MQPRGCVLEYGVVARYMQPNGCVYGGWMQNDTVEILPPAEAIVEVDIDADLESVWHALTTDDGLASWIGAGSTIGSAPGEELHVHDIVTGQHKRGFLDEVTPLKRLGYTWWPETQPEHSTRVAISLAPSHTGTRVTVVESRPTRPVAKVPLSTSASLPAVAVSSCAAPSLAAFGLEWAWRHALLGVSLKHAPVMSAPRR